MKARSAVRSCVGCLWVLPLLLFACGQGPEGESTAGEQASDLRVFCPIGEALCSGVCRNTRTDPAHCGTCGTACASGAACVSGVCE